MIIILLQVHERMLHSVSKPGIETVASLSSSFNHRVASLYSLNSTGPIVHFTIVCLEAKPLNRSDARVYFVVIQTLLLFICKSLCYHAY